MTVRRLAGLRRSNAPAPLVPLQQSGTITTPGASSGTVVFPVAFTTAPKIAVRMLTPNQLSAVEVSNVTVTGFSWNCLTHEPAGSATPASVNPSAVEWIAFEGSPKYA